MANLADFAGMNEVYANVSRKISRRAPPSRSPRCPKAPAWKSKSLCIFNPVGDPLSLPKNMPVGIVILITTVIAGGLGWLIGWWMRRNRAASTTPSDLRLENELRWHLAQREAEVVMKRDQLTQTIDFPRHRAGEPGSRRAGNRGSASRGSVLAHPEHGRRN